MQKDFSPAEILSATRYEQEKTSDTVKLAASLIGNEATVLEIGPATGMLTRIIATEQRCQVTAIEIDADAAELTRPLCKAIHVADIDTVELSTLLGDQKFDVATFGDVLEHLRSPVGALKKVKPYLTDGGCVVLSVPNIAHASIAYELANGRFDYRPTGLLDVTHIHFFTRKSLLLAIEEAGYVVTDFERITMRPEQTEFKTRAYGEGQQQLLQYFQAVNPESNTYQFVARIVPRKGNGPYVTEAVVAQLVQKVEFLQGQMDVQRARAERLESELHWIEDRWHVRFARRLKRFLSAP